MCSREKRRTKMRGFPEVAAYHSTDRASRSFFDRLGSSNASSQVQRFPNLIYIHRWCACHSLRRSGITESLASSASPSRTPTVKFAPSGSIFPIHTVQQISPKRHHYFTRTAIMASNRDIISISFHKLANVFVDCQVPPARTRSTYRAHS